MLLPNVGARAFPADFNSHSGVLVFVILETERLCKFVSLVMFVPGEH